MLRTSAISAVISDVTACSGKPFTITPEWRHLGDDWQLYVSVFIYLCVF